MCKKLLVLLLVLGLAGSAWSITVNSKSPILEWSFEGNNNDTSGNAYHATAGSHSGYVGDALPGAGTQSAQFDGIDDVISRSGGIGLLPVDNESFTISVLVKCGDYATGYHGEFGFGTPNSGYSTRTIAADVGGANRAYFMNGSGNAQIGYYTANEWSLLTVTSRYKDGGVTDGRGTVHCYINGVLKTGPVTLTKYQTASQYVAAGELKQTNYASDWFTGLADEFTIWDVELTADDVADLWDLYNVPEPATICLLGLGGLALLRKRR